MRFADSYQQIKGGATETDMFNNARNEMSASYIKQLLDAGKGERSTIGFESTFR